MNEQRSMVWEFSLQVEAGVNAELPLWLCKILVSKELVTVRRPTFLGDRCVCQAPQRGTPCVAQWPHQPCHAGSEPHACSRVAEARLKLLSSVRHAHDRPVPRCRIQRRLNAGAACENLKARCPYFYAAAKEYSELCAAHALRTFALRPLAGHRKRQVQMSCLHAAEQAAPRKRTREHERLACEALHRSAARQAQVAYSCSRCREEEPDGELARVVFGAYRERYHKLAGGALGLDRSEDINDFRQKLSQEELHRAPPRAALRCAARCLCDDCRLKQHDSVMHCLCALWNLRPRCLAAWRHAFWLLCCLVAPMLARTGLASLCWRLLDAYALVCHAAWHGLSYGTLS
jgi:hypothetical protein